MQFANPQVLFLLFLIPAFHFWWRKRNRAPALRMPLPLESIPRSFDPSQLSLILRYFSFAMFVLALARPQASHRLTERTVSGLDIMMVMDVSASMNIEDLAERSRLEIAKETMKSFVQKRSNDRIGFVAFSGEPITLAPPTLDYGIVLQAIHDVEIGLLKDGTAIGDGLSLAIARLRESKAKSRVIILLTDGDNNVGQVDPATAGDLAAGYGIKVYTIAIGREGRVKLPIREKGMFGKVYTRYQTFENALNPELLQQIAKITGGKFYRVTDEGTLDQVFKEIDQLEKSDVKTNEKVQHEERFDRPLKWGLLSQLVDIVLNLAVWGVLW